MKLGNPDPDRLPGLGGRAKHHRTVPSRRPEPTRDGRDGGGTGHFGRWRDGIATWQSTTFGPASEEPYRRRVADWTALVFAAAVLAGLTFRADHPSTIEVDVFRLINGLPSQLSSTFRAFSAAGTLWAVCLVVAAALVGRRERLARDLLLAGLAAWAVAHFTGAVAAGDGFTQSLRALSHLRARARTSRWVASPSSSPWLRRLCRTSRGPRGERARSSSSSPPWPLSTWAKGCQTTCWAVSSSA